MVSAAAPQRRNCPDAPSCPSPPGHQGAAGMLRGGRPLTSPPPTPDRAHPWTLLSPRPTLSPLRAHAHPRTPPWKKSWDYLEAPRSLQSRDSSSHLLTACLVHSKAWRILRRPRGAPGPAELGGELRLCVSDKLAELSTGPGQGAHLRVGF